jgi:hypothetical protein
VVCRAEEAGESEKDPLNLIRQGEKPDLRREARKQTLSSTKNRFQFPGRFFFIWEILWQHNWNW